MNVTKKEHYKMYKAGRQWIFAAIAAFSVAGVSGLSQSSTSFLNLGSFKASADFLSGTTSITESMLQSITNFATPEDAVIGQYANLPLVTGVAQDIKDPNENIDFQVNNAYIRKYNDHYIAAYVPGVTTFTVTTHGARNSVEIYAITKDQYRQQQTFQLNPSLTPTQLKIMGAADYYDYYYDQIGEVQKKGVLVAKDLRPGKDQTTKPISINNNVIPVGQNGDNMMLQLRYTSDNSKRVGGSGYYVFYTPELVQFRTQSVLQFEISQAELSKSDSQAQKNTSTSNLTSLASSLIAQIQNDSSLTSVQQENQVNNVNNTLQTALSDLNSKDNASAVSASEKYYTGQLNSQYQTGIPLTTQQNNAINNFQSSVSSAIQAIQNSSQLTSAEKQRRLKLINDSFTKLQENVNGAINADGINNVVNQTTLPSTIVKALDFTTFPSLEEQKFSAVSDVETERINARRQVDADDNLTASEKQSQKVAIDNLASMAESSLNNAQNAQVAADARMAAIDTLKGLYAQKKVARDAVDQRVNTALTLIKANLALTATDQQNRITSIIDQQRQTKDHIDQDQSQVNILASQNNANLASTISNSINFQNVLPISQQQANTINHWRAIINQAIGNINASINLTTNEKKTRIGALNTSLNLLSNMVNAANSADLINAATSDNNFISSYNINSNLATATPVATRIADAQALIAQTANDAKTDVDNDDTLSSTEKDIQKHAIDLVVANQNKALSNQTTADNVAMNLSFSIGFVKNLHAQKSGFRQYLKQKSQVAINNINSNINLTVEQKKQRTDYITTALDSLLKLIDSSATATDFREASDSGKKVQQIFDSQSDFSSVPLLADQQKEVQNSFGKEVNDAISAIQSNHDLTTSQKTERIQLITVAQESFDQAIQAATNADDLQKVKTNDQLTRAINKALLSDDVIPLTSQKEDAKQDYDKAAQAAIQSIEENNDLTSDQKSSFVSAIQSAEQKAKQAVDQADNADGVNQERASQDFNDAVKNGINPTNIQPLATQKDCAKTKVANQVADVIKVINSNNDLTDDQKKSRIIILNQVLDKVQGAIDQSRNADSVNQNKNSSDFDAALIKSQDFSKVSSLSIQQQNALSNLSRNQALAKEAIDADDSLTDVEKTDQRNAIDEAVQRAKVHINDSKKAQDLEDWQNVDLNEISNLHDQMAMSRQQLHQKAEQAIGEIKANTSLKYSEQQDRVNEILSVLKVALSNVDQANTVANAQANETSDSLNQVIRKQTDFHDVVPLDQQKVIAVNNLDTIVKTAVNQVMSNKALLSTEKTKRVTAINASYNQVKDVINSAINRDQVDTAVISPSLTATISTATNFDEILNLDQQKKKASDNLSQMIQPILDWIKNNVNLNRSQKEQRITNIQNALQRVQGNIDDAVDSDGITNASQDQILQDVVAAGKSESGIIPLSDQKVQAYSIIESTQNQAKSQDISTDKELSDDEKMTQNEAIDRASQMARDQIKLANDAQGVIDAQNEGVSILNKMHEAKSTARQALIQETEIGIQDIQNNVDLTHDQKVSRIKIITDQLAVSTNLIDQASSLDAVLEAQNNQNVHDVIASQTNFAGVVPLAGQQAAVMNIFNDRVTKALNLISSATNLRQNQKDERAAKITAAYNAAQLTISSTENSDDLAQAVHSVSLNQVINDQTDLSQILSLADQVNIAVSNLNSLTDKAINQIRTNQLLTTFEQDERINKIAIARDRAIANISQAVNSDGVDSAANDQILSKAIQDGESIQGVPSLVDQQKSAIKIIQSAQKSAKDQDIASDYTLDTVSQLDQGQAVDSISSSAENQVSQAQSAQAILDAQNNGVITLQNIHSQKFTARQSTADAANQAENQINNNVNLNRQEKASRIDMINQALGRLNTRIDKETDVAAIIVAPSDSDYQKALNQATDFQGVVTLADQQRSATIELNKKVSDAVKIINDNVDLSQNDKTNRIAQIVAAYTQVKNLVNAATDSDSIINAQSTSNLLEVINTVTSFDGVIPLAGQKTQAQNSLSKLAKETIANILKNVNLTQLDQNIRMARVVAALDRADTNIDQAINSDGVSSAQADKTFSNILATAQGNDGVQSLSDRQIKAVQQINDLVNSLFQQDIEPNADLDTTSKQDQKTALQNIAKVFTDQITNDSTAQMVVNDLSAALNKISQVNNQKKVIREAIYQKSQSAIQTIQNNVDLSGVEQAVRIGSIQMALMKANAVIDQATDLTTIKSVVADNADFLTNLNAQTNFQSIKSLSTQKEDAKKSFKQDVDQAIGQILGNTDLTKDAQQSRVSVLSQALSQLDALIDQSTNSDAVKIASQSKVYYASYKQATDFSQVVPLAKQKIDGQRTIDGQVVSALGMIEDNHDLSRSEKDNRKNKIIAAQQAVDQQIQLALNSDAVVAVINDSTLIQTIEDNTNFKTVTPLDQQKVAAENKLSQWVKNAISQIEGYVSLSSKEQQTRINDMTLSLEQVKQRIENATDSDAVARAEEDNGLVRAVTRGLSQDGITSLADQKSQYVTIINDKIHAAIDKVDNNLDLTNDEKLARFNQLTSAQNTALAAINSANNNDDLTTVLSSQNLQTALTMATNPAILSVEQRKLVAAKAIEKAQEVAQAAVDNDETLSESSKNQQKQSVVEATVTAQTAVQAAQNAQEVVDTENREIAILAGLSSKKQNARQSLTNLAQIANQTIKTNSDLSSNEQNNRMNAINEALARALEQVDQAIDLDQVAHVQENDKLSAVISHQTDFTGVKSLSDQQNDATKDLNQQVTDALTKINENINLSQTQKNNRIDSITKVYGQIKSAIIQATNSDQVNDALLSMGFQKVLSIAIDFSGVQNLSDQINEAQNDLDQQVQTVIDWVDQNVNFTQGDKIGRINHLLVALDRAKVNITQATNSDGVLAAKNDVALETTINAAYSLADVTLLPERITEAVVAVGQFVNQAQQLVQHDETLNKVSQNLQEQALIQASNQFVNNLKDAKQAQTVVDQLKIAQITFNTLGQQKKNSRDTLDLQAQKAISIIKGNVDLTEQEQSDRVDEINQILQLVQQNVDSSTTLDDANKRANSDELTMAINKALDFSSVVSLSQQKELVSKQLNQVVTEAIGDINREPSLSQVQKNERVETITQAYNNARLAVSKAANSDAIKAAKDDPTLLNIINKEKDLTNILTLEQQRIKANASLQGVAQVAVDQINSNVDMTQSEKDIRIDKINTALDRAVANVNLANSSDDISAAVQEQSLTNAITSGTNGQGITTLADRKNQAIQAIQVNQSSAKNNSIATDQALSETNKADQNNAVDSFSKASIDLINNAHDAQEVLQIQQNAINTLTNLHVVKGIARRVLNLQADQVIEKIRQNIDLNQNEKADRLQAFNQALDQTIKSVDQAVTLGDVQSAQDSLIFNQALKVASDFNQVTDLAHQKEAVIHDFKEMVLAATKVILSNVNLTKEQKNQRNQVIQTSLDELVQKLQGAQDSDALKTIKENQTLTSLIQLEQNFDGIQSLIIQKKMAVDSVNQLVKVAVNKIQNNVDLKQREKDARIGFIINAKKQAEDLIQSAMNSDQVQQGVNDISLPEVIKEETNFDQVTSLSVQEQAYIQQLSNLVQVAVNTIKDNHDLQSSEKDRRIKLVQEAKNKAHSQIQTAANSDDLDDIFDQAKSQMAVDLKSSTDFSNVLSLADQKVKLNQDIQNLVNEASQNLSHAVVLTQADQAARLSVIQEQADKLKAKVLASQDSESAHQEADINALKKTITSETDITSIPTLDEQKKDYLDQIYKVTDSARKVIIGYVNIGGVEKDERLTTLQKVVDRVTFQISTTSNRDDLLLIGSNSKQAVLNAVLVSTDISKVKTLSEQRTLVQQKFTDQVQIAIDKIVSYEALKKEDQNKRIDDLRNLQNQINQELSNATDSDGLQKTRIAEDARMKVVLDRVLSLNGILSLDQQKKDAKDEFNIRSQDAIKIIQNNVDLEQASRDSRIQMIIQAQKNLDSLITTAKNSDQVSQATSNPILMKAIGMGTDFTGVKALADQKLISSQAIDQQVTSALQMIDQEDKLTQADKTQREQAILLAQKAFHQRLSAAKDSDSVIAVTANPALEQILSLQTDFSGIPSLTDQQDQVKNSLAEIVKKASQDIQNNSALTTNDQQNRINKINQALLNAQQSVIQSSNSDQVNAVSHSTEFDAVIQSQTDFSKVPSLSDQKQTAISALSEQVEAAKEQIDRNPDLTEKQRDERCQAIDVTLKSAVNVIKKVNNSDDLNDQLAVVTPKVVSEISSQTDFSQITAYQIVQSGYQAELSRLVDQAIAQVENNVNLRSDEKNRRIRLIRQAQGQYDQSLSDAKNREDLNHAVETSQFQTIVNEMTDFSGIISLDQQKQVVQASFAQQVNEAIRKVEANVNLSRFEKSERVNILKNALITAESRVNWVKNSDSLSSVTTNFTLSYEIDRQTDFSNVVPLSQQKEIIKHILGDFAKKAIKLLKKSVDLRQNQKESRIQLIIQNQKRVDQGIDQALNSDGVTDVQNALILLEGIRDATNFQDVLALSDQKNEAEQLIFERSNQVIADIQSDSSLTDAEKEQQVNSVSQAVAKTADQIAYCKNADELSDIQEMPTLKTDILQGHRSAILSLSDRIKSAKNLLLDLVQSQTLVINNDSTLNQGEKDRQVEELNFLLKYELQKVSDLNLAQDVVNFVQSAQIKVNNVHQIGRSLNDQQHQSWHWILDKESLLRREIQADVNLTEQDKQSILTRIDRWLQAQHALIKESKSADEIIRQQQNIVQTMQTLYQDSRVWHSWLSRQRFLVLPETGRTNNSSFELPLLLSSIIFWFELMNEKRRVIK